MTDNRTTELREKLTELDVKWWPMRNNGYYEDRDTEFVVNGKKYTAHEWGDGLAVYNITPEQAIAATLGEKRTCETCDELDNVDSFINHLIQAERHELTCTNVNTDGYEYRFDCSCCGHSVIVHDCSLRLDVLPNYCPSCGRKIVSP